MQISFIILSVISMMWNRSGSICYLLLAVVAVYFFGKMNAGFFLVSVPLVGLGLLYWFGKLESRRLAYFLVLGLPLLQILGIGAFQGIRVGNRFNDGNFDARMIKGNSSELIWAPQGIGWPDNGTSWYEAKKICAYLIDDGKTLSNT